MNLIKEYELANIPYHLTWSKLADLIYTGSTITLKSEYSGKNYELNLTQLLEELFFTYTENSLSDYRKATEDIDIVERFKQYVIIHKYIDRGDIGYNYGFISNNELIDMVNYVYKGRI